MGGAPFQSFVGMLQGMLSSDPQPCGEVAPRETARFLAGIWVLPSLAFLWYSATLKPYQLFRGAQVHTGRRAECQPGPMRKDRRAS